MLFNYKISHSKGIMYALILNVLIFFILYQFNIYIANNTKFYELLIVKDIIGINVIVGFISIFSFFLYSYLYDDDYFHMFFLIYISLYFEFVFITLFRYKLSILNLIESDMVFIGIAAIFRTIIMWMAFYDENCINIYLKKNKVLAVFLSIIITFMCIVLELYLMEHNILSSYTIIIKFIKYLGNIITSIILLKFCILYLRKKNSNYFITFLGTEVMFLARLLLSSNLYDDKYCMYILNRVILALGFSIIIIGMFWEIISRTKENKILTKQCYSQQLEMNRLKQEDELRTQFFANISHELRTPLNILICSYQLLKSKSNNKDDLYNYYHKYSDTITTNSSRMLRLINNIIDASKFEAGCFKMNFKNSDIISIIEDVTLSIAQCGKIENRNIIFDTNTEYLEIKCDTDNIERVILNLLSNAIKFTHKDGNIFVVCEEKDTELIIKVKDDGIGIPKEFRERIFDRFVQVNKTFRRNVEGSGIGLSLVKFIVDSHGGQVYINDEVEIGCEFIVKIPKLSMDEECGDSKTYPQSLRKDIDLKVDIELSDIR